MRREPDNVTAMPRRRPTNGDNGGGGDSRERLVRLETRMDYVATKSDLTEMESRLVKWMMGAITVSTIALTAAVIGFLQLLT